jgi:hypothetical protein
MTIFATLEKFATKVLGIDTGLEWVNEKAQYLGIDTEGRSNIDVIHDIQLAEGNDPCFGSCKGQCESCDCCFYDACIRYGF